jgi:hypothetical protein
MRYALLVTAEEADIRIPPQYRKSGVSRSNRFIYRTPRKPISSPITLSSATMTLTQGTIHPHVNGDANGSTNGAAGKRLRIAVIPGDGIGTEVMVEGLRSLRAAAKR